MNKDLIKCGICGEDTYKCIFNKWSVRMISTFSFILLVKELLLASNSQNYVNRNTWIFYIFFLNVKIINLMGLADVLYLMFFPLNLFL